MLAFIKYENGAKFKNIIFENEKAAELWLKKNKICNPRCFDLVEVEYIKENDEELKRFDLEYNLKDVTERLTYITEMYEDFLKREDEDGKNLVKSYHKTIVELTIKKHELEIELLKLDQEKAE